MRITLNRLMVLGVAVGCIAMCVVVRAQVADLAAGGNPSAAAAMRAA